jgi:hypothetical protein
LHHRADWITRLIAAIRLLVSITGNRLCNVASVVGPNESESALMPSSYWRTRVSARIVAQPVIPSSSSFGMPVTLYEFTNR